MKIKFLVIFLSILLLPVYVFASEDLTVAVAANLQYTFKELKAVFEQQSGIAIKEVIGSSGKFVSQIENGAPFDLFLSADTDYPQALKKKNLTFNDPKVYAYGKLVLWTLNDIDLSDGIKSISKDSIKKIAVAVPNTAPYGRESISALKRSGLYDKVSKRLVYAESIAQVNQFITTQAVDLGFTAKSVVMAENMKDKGHWIEVDENLYTPIAQSAVILKYASKDHLDSAKKFFDFLYSDPARKIFQKYGYGLP